MTRIPTAPIGKIFVTVDKRYNDEITLESGLKLYQDTTFRPEWHSNISGKVVSVPRSIGEHLENRGIVPEVLVGDRIWFLWTVCNDVANLVEIDGNEYWMINYCDVICIQRFALLDDFETAISDMIPVGGKALIRAVETKREEMTAGGIILPQMIAEEQRKDIGKLIWIGTPREGQTACTAEVGDVVIFPAAYSNAHTIDGVEYFVVDQDDIQGCIPKEKPVKKKKK
jgi:co-chaperonin GroES (HSP10)